MNKLAYARKTWGWIRTLGIVRNALLHRFAPGLASLRRARADANFDAKHAVRTRGWIAVRDCSVIGALAGASDYVALPEWAFIDCIKPLRKLRNIDLSQYAFVDLGSGMGRVLLLAAEYPFRKVVGVEFSPELHEIAVANIELARGFTRRCTDISSVCMRAEAYPFDDGPQLVFMFNPFDTSVMRTVIERLKQRAVGRDLILYCRPRQSHLFERDPDFVLLDGCDIWDQAFRLWWRSGSGGECSGTFPGGANSNAELF